jgi:hypothetical protein
MEDNKQTKDDRTAKMNQFFADMEAKIKAEEQQKQTTPPLTEVPKSDFTPPTLKKEPEKQTFFDSMKSFKQELDPLATDAINKTFDTAEDLFGKAKEKATDLFQKFDKYTDGLEEKMRKENEDYERQLKEKANRPHNTGESFFKGTGGLFEKAEQFLNQDKKTENPLKEGEIKIIQPDKPIKKKVSNDPIYGFDDLDGDGNPIFDDAIIE